MTTALATRLVFIDTSAFEKKNFQFGQYSLGRLQELIAQEKLYLLMALLPKSVEPFPSPAI